MKAKDWLEEIAAKYSLRIEEQYDSDYDVLLPEGKVPKGLKGTLKKYGYKYYEEEGTLTSSYLHIHAPMRKEKSWSDKGWGWEIPGTPKQLPGEGPYYGENYLGGSMFSES